MTRVIENLAEISADYDTLYCDLWGCLHDGRQVYTAAVAALQKYRQSGGQVVLMTNAPRPAASVIAQIERLGAPPDAWDLVVSSGDAAQIAMLDAWAGREVWHLGPPKDDVFFTDLPRDKMTDADAPVRVPLEEAEVIICTGLFDDTTETPEDYRKTLEKALDRGLPMLCANPDIVVDLGERRVYCAGAIAALYADMGGKVTLYGKPHAPIYDLARRRLAEGDGTRAPVSPLIIGDGILTDVEGGVNEGTDVLFVTGGLAFDKFGDDVEKPVREMLLEWLAQHGREPKWAIGRLR